MNFKICVNLLLLHLPFISVIEHKDICVKLLLNPMGVKYLNTVTKAWSEDLQLCIVHNPDRTLSHSLDVQVYV